MPSRFHLKALQAAFLLPFLTLSATTAMAAPGDITVKPGTPIWVDASEPEPVKLAARDLARDFEKVFGVKSPIVADRSQLRGQTFIEVLSPTAAAAKADRRPDIAGREAHGVFTKSDGQGARVVLQGTDVRGTVYAIYTFSEKFLGVKPLWFWASQPPAPKKSVVVAAKTNVRFGQPSVRWRTWFPNDTDLFSPWEKRSQTNFDALYEAMLRLKLNCLEGTSADRDSLKPPYRLARSVETARDRGLAFVGHHSFIFGSDYNLWDEFWRQIEHREPPAFSVNSFGELKTFWRWHIGLSQRNKLEQIWLINFRGNGDRTFWESFKDSPKTDAERAKVIDRMMKAQVELVKEGTRQAAPVMRTTLYNELSDLYAAGLLRPPAEPNLIWSFVAARRDHFPAPDVQNAKLPPNQPVGYYLNFQFTSTGAHLAQAEGPWKMERNYRYVQSIAPRPLEFAVVNMGNIREFVLEGSANAAMMWDFKKYNSDAFLVEFCRTYFGDANADAVEALYRDYFNSFWQQRQPTLKGFERQYLFQDLRLNRVMMRLIAAFKQPGTPTEEIFADGNLDKNGRLFNVVAADNNTKDQLSALIKGTEQSITKLNVIVARADQLQAKLPAANRTFFNDNLRVQARFMLAANQATHYLALAVRDSKADPERKANGTAHLNAAHAAALQMKVALKE
ncbi:hypothetical protein EON80_19520, partial [bacterium]